MKQLLRRLEWLFRRGQFEHDLEEEMRHHLAMKAEASGEAAAARQFGNLALLKEESRAAWRFAFWEQLAQDVRYGLRAMRTNRLFTAMAVLSLGLGIGANTAIYSFMHAILLRSLPVQHPEELTVFTWRAPRRAWVVRGFEGTVYPYGHGGEQSPDFPYAAWLALRGNQQITSPLFAYTPAYQLNVVARNQAEVKSGMYVSGNFYSGLGVVPALGRLISDEDDRSGSAHVAVITFDYWRTRFVSDPSAIGRTILINTVPFTVIGVSAPGFFGIDSAIEPAVFIPLHARPLFARDPADDERNRFFNPNFYWVEMMGRLRPGVSPEQAQAVLGGVFHRLVESTAKTARERQRLPQFVTQPGAGGRDTLRRQYARPLYVLMTMVGLIFVIACANIANLMLARSLARRREIATRLSLGASRGRVIRQLLTESTLLSLTGGLAGIGVALWGIRSIAWLLSNGQKESVMGARLDWPVPGFKVALALLAGILFGLAPALQSTRGNPTPALKEAQIGGTRAQYRLGLGHILVIAQIAISLLLVVAAGLFARTLANLRSIALGFNRQNLLIFSVNAREAGYGDERLARFYAQLADRFRAVPGVRSASLSDVPLVASFINNVDVTMPGQTAKLDTCLLLVGESFFETMQIPILIGREIDRRDIGNPRAAVVSELFAKKYFPGQNPVGHRIHVEDPPADLEIAGVAKTTLYTSLKEVTPPVLYLPYTFHRTSLRRVWFELRTAGDPLDLAASVREIVHQEAPTVPVTNLTTQAAQIDGTISQERTFTDLCTCFAALALVIACVGLYGMAAYAVVRRTSEIGIRMALGAERGRIIWMMLRQVVALAIAGISAGLVAAWQSAHVLASFLYGVKPLDALAIWGAAAILFCAALSAAWGPARRAARVDPMVALRNE